MREFSFNVSIVNDSIPEGDEMFRVSLTLDSAGQDRLSSRVRVSPNVATVTILDDGKDNCSNIFQPFSIFFLVLFKNIFNFLTVMIKHSLVNTILYLICNV